MSTARPGSGLRVRPAAPDQHADVGRLVLAAYDGVGAITGPYRDELADTAGRVEAGSLVLVATLDGDLAGTVTVVAADGPHFEHGPHGDGGMRMLAVDPAAQGHGVGAALVEAVLEHAVDAGWRRLVLTSMTWMHAAHRLYQRRGFVRRPDLDLRFGSGVGLVFQRDLVEAAAGAFPAPGPVPASPPRFVHRPTAPPLC